MLGTVHKEIIKNLGERFSDIVIAAKVLSQFRSEAAKQTELRLVLTHWAQWGLGTIASLDSS